VREHPVERLLREIRRERILNGTSEIQRLIVANAIRKRGLGALPMIASGQTRLSFWAASFGF
jgi:acyl-CoA dehydrogenase